jgi:hypothetical protein
MLGAGITFATSLASAAGFDYAEKYRKCDRHKKPQKKSEKWWARDPKLGNKREA